MQKPSWLSSREATWRPRPRLLSWPGDEVRHPSRVRACNRALRVRKRVPDPIDEARAARRDLLELPPVLHGQAEARRHGRPGGAVPAPPRAGASRQVVLTETMASLIGGQAVLEGVMMRGPSNWSVAVRKPDGDIAQVSQPIVSPMTRPWLLRLPVIRGVIALGESLAIGFRALAISANYAAQEEGEDGEVTTE